MKIPKNIEELCDNVHWKEYADCDWPGLEGVAMQAPWTSAYLESPLVSNSEKFDIFLFYLACTGLERIERHPGLEISLLQDIRDIYFADSEFYQPSIHFVDIHNKLDDIFRLFSLDLRNESTRTELRSHIISLKQDEAVRSGLKAVTIEFIKNTKHHPTSLQACTMSIL